MRECCLPYQNVQTISFHNNLLDFTRRLVHFGNHDGTSATAALGTSQLGTSESHDIAKKAQERLIGTRLFGETSRYTFTIDKEDGRRSIS